MSRIRFGWSEVSLVPDRPISLAGEFFERVTSEVETPITVTTLAVEEDGEQAFFCSCDLEGVGRDLCLRVRARVGEKNPKIQTDKIMLHAVHIHNSYVYEQAEGGVRAYEGGTLGVIRDFMPADCKYIPQITSTDCIQPDEARDILVERIARSVLEAYDDLGEGGFAQGFGRVAVGMNRRAVYSDGSAKMWGDVDRATFVSLEGGNDTGMELLYIYDKAGKMTGIVANVACPAQIMEQRSVISADYWGKVKILLREKHGEDFKLLALVSPAGDLCPRDLIRWVEPETPIKDPNVTRIDPKERFADPSMFDVKGTWKAGRRIFNEIESEMEDIGTVYTEGNFAHTVKTLRLPLRRVTDGEAEEARRVLRDALKDKKTLDYKDSAELYVYAGTLKRYESQEVFETVDTEVHAIRIGRVAFVTSPFELFLDFGNQIRARSVATQTFEIQLCCGALGYLPTEKAEKGGHYSAYVSSGVVGHEGGDLLVRESLDMIKDLFEK